jgi:hypothetical protein
MPAVGSILTVFAGQYNNQFNYEATGTTAAFTAYSITLNGGSATNNAYVDYALCYVNQANPPINRGIESYDGSTKIATLYPYGWSSLSPQNRPLQGTVTTFGDTTIYLGGSPYASGTSGDYVGFTLAFKNQTNSPTPRTIVSYNGGTKTATLSGANWGGYAPVANTTVWALYSWEGYEPIANTTVWGVCNAYPVQRRYQWYKGNVAISALNGGIGGAYTPPDPSEYSVQETAYFPATSNLTTVTTANCTITGTRDPNLVYADNLVWEGCFFTPDYYPNPNYVFGYAIAYNPAGNEGAGSLFLNGGGTIGIGEITIPTPSKTSPPTASTIQNIVLDPLEGQSPAGIAGDKLLGGLLVDGGKLIITLHALYSAITNGAWFWRRPLNLSTTGQLEGPFAVADATYRNNPRCYAGYVTTVPTALQSKLGGTHICGLAAQSIDANTSDGPAIASFNLSDFTASAANSKQGAFVAANSTTMTLSSGTGMSGTNNFYNGYWLTSKEGLSAAKVVTAYDGGTKVASIAPSTWAQTPTSGSWFLIPPIAAKALAMYEPNGFQNVQGTTAANYPYLCVWDDTSSGGNMGTVVPNGTRSVLMMERGGNNFYEYSSPTQVRGGVKCYDPSESSTGEHNYPYFLRCWAYDANELEQARLGNINPNNMKPYAVWNLQMPIYDNGKIGGMTYDAANKRIFVTNISGGAGRIVVHVFSISNATSP